MKLTFYIFLFFVLAGCNRNVTATKGYKEKITSHRTIAILPFDMTLNLTKGQQEIITEKDRAVLSQTLSLDLQKKLYSMLLKHIKKNALSVQVQNVDETLEKLSANNVRFNDLHNPDKAAILKLLGVDAVLDPQMSITQQGVAFTAAGPLFIPPAGVAIVDVRNLYIGFSVGIKDLSTDTAFWSYKSGEWYMAPNKLKKNKKEASDDFLSALFLNVDDIFKAFISKDPYLKK